jgi:hypothetical protein
MIAGPPGAGKTQLALALADGMKLPTLYFSNDSNEATVASRLIARRLRVSTDRVEAKMHRDPKWAAEQLRDVDHIKWSFSPNPTLPDVEAEILAFQEVYGAPPVLVVVDVLMKMNYQEESDHGTAIRIVDYLGTIARDHSACVLLVHHASEAYQGNPCVPRAAILQKVSQFPVTILTVAPMPFTGHLAVCAVKNRHGRQDPTGQDHFLLAADLSQNWFEDVTER